MSNITNFEEQPPESPLDVLSRVATMVEKSQTSPTASAALPAAKSADQSTANLMYHPSIGTGHNELNSTHSPPPSSEAHQNSQSKKCERSPSFKERHPKFRKSSTPDYMLAADQARTIKLNRQSSLSETSTANDHTSTNLQTRNNTLASVDTPNDTKTTHVSPKSLTMAGSLNDDNPYSQVSSSCTFPLPHSVYTSSYDHLQPNGTETIRREPCLNEFGSKPMEQDPHPNEEEEGPIDMSIKKRSESPPPSPPYRYTPLTLTGHANNLPKSPQGLKVISPGQATNATSPPVQHILAPPTHPVVIAPPPSYSAATRPPPPPYPSSPSPPIASSTNQISQNSIKREPPPSYGSTFPSPPNRNNSITSTRMDYHTRHDNYPICDSTRQDDRKIREVTIITDSSADPLLDEHFRRALGEKNYESIFNNKKGENISSEQKSPPISSSSNTMKLNRPQASSPHSSLHSSTLNEVARASRIDPQRPRSPANSSLNSSSSSITSSEISVTRITPKSSPDGKTEQKTSSEVDVDPVKAFQDDMKLEDEGYTVEDHFAKALGDTWVKLKAAEAKAKGGGTSQNQPDSSTNQTSNKNEATSSNQKIKSEKVSSSRSTPTPPPMPKWGLKVA